MKDIITVTFCHISLARILLKCNTKLPMKKLWHIIKNYPEILGYEYIFTLTSEFANISL